MQNHSTFLKENDRGVVYLRKLQETLSNYGRISILGHDTIDVDSVLSGILLSKLLTFLEYDNEFFILEPIKEDETFDIVSTLTGINMKEYEESSEDERRTLILVDHYETTHLGHVVACIDHHPTEKENTYEFSYVRNATSATYMILELMKAAHYPLTYKEARMVIVGMMVDTVSFRSSKAILEEVEVAKKLSYKYALNYDYLEKNCLCLTPIDKMYLEQIISNGQKWYEFHHEKVGSSYLQLYDMPDDQTLKKWLRILSQKLQDTHSKILVFLIFDMKNNITYEYQVTKYFIKKIIHDGILSRGKDIIPKIEKRLNSEPDAYFRLNIKMEAIIQRLTERKETIATMESCTGGSLAGTITDFSGASEILHESYVTYCNEAKIKHGVPKEVIDNYTVYSLETAKAMAKAVKDYANSSVGIGVTGQLGRVDSHNIGVDTNIAWYAICGKKEIACEMMLTAECHNRKQQKRAIIGEIIDDLYHL